MITAWTKAVTIRSLEESNDVEYSEPEELLDRWWRNPRWIWCFDWVTEWDVIPLTEKGAMWEAVLGSEVIQEYNGKHEDLEQFEFGIPMEEDSRAS